MKKVRTRILGALGVAAVIMSAAASGVLAQDLPKLHIKTIGSATYLYQYKAAEVPFWGKTITEKSGGQVTAELLPYDTVGLKGHEILRLLKIGAFEFANGGLIIVARDDPVLEGTDLAGTVLTIETLRKTLDAYRPVIDRVMQKKWNSKLLLLGPNPPQVFWCNAKISGVADFKGLKIRVFGTTLADFVKGAGATAVTMPSSQVVQAMQRNLIDCAVTGTSNGNSAKWPEVTTHLYPAYAGWAPTVLGGKPRHVEPTRPEAPGIPCRAIEGAREGGLAARGTGSRAGRQLQRRPRGVHDARPDEVQDDPGADLQSGRRRHKENRQRARGPRVGQAMRQGLRPGVEQHGRRRDRSQGPDVGTQRRAGENLERVFATVCVKSIPPGPGRQACPDWAGALAHASLPDWKQP